MPADSAPQASPELPADSAPQASPELPADSAPQASLELPADSAPQASLEFERHRGHLLRVAYRLLGSHADAEDAVQEAWLRWDATDRAQIVDARAWLVTVTSRICLNQLRSARSRRESYVGPWLPEPVVRRLPGGEDPADEVVRGDEVSYALLVVMERLTPDQRVAFVLHDAFGVPFDEIATTLHTTPEAARQHASRARRAVTTDGAARQTADKAEQQRVLTAFAAATRSGDLAALVAVLAPDVVAMGDGGGVVPAGRRAVRGADRVARLLLGLSGRFGTWATSLEIELVLVNDDLGLLVGFDLPDGSRVRAAMAFAIADGRITAVFNQLNPAKLSRLPSP